MANKPIEIKSKLFTLKKWLTVSETARHLSIMFDEEVNESDIYRLALDRHLKLSVNFVNKAEVKRGGKFLPFLEWEIKFREMVSWETANAVITQDRMIGFSFPDHDGAFYFKYEGIVNNDVWKIGFRQHGEEVKKEFLNSLSAKEQSELLTQMQDSAIAQTKKLSVLFDGKVPPNSRSFSGKVFTIDGVWDLPMLGAERLNIEHEFQMLTNGPEITLTNIDGAFIEGKDGVVYQLQEVFDKEYLDEMQSKKKKEDRINSYAEFLKKKVSNNEIDEKEAEKLLQVRKKNLERPWSHDDQYYPAGGLPEDSVIVVRTQALRDFVNNFSSDSTYEKNSQIQILDSKHPFHAKELLIAVEAWIDLYEKNPPLHVPQGGHKKYISKWLEENYPHLGQRARDRIATIINPNPKGGASPII